MTYHGEAVETKWLVKTVATVSSLLCTVGKLILSIYHDFSILGVDLGHFLKFEVFARFCRFYKFLTG